MTAAGEGRVQIGRSVTLGNLVSPALTVLALGIPGLIWAGKVDSRVEGLGNDMKTVRSEMADVKASAQTTASTLIGINFTISEGLKQTMADQARRLSIVEQRLDALQQEHSRLQIELATIKRASEPRGRP